jgi:glycosyltransferase involved in cell wall biosynthesis
MAKADRLDLYHTTYIAPLMLPCRSLVTVHDVLFETVPEFFTTSFVWRSRLLVRHSVRHAAQVHTISKYSKDLIASQYSVPKSNIRLVPAGIDLQRFYPHDKKSARKIARTEYGVSDFILTVGRLEPRKNHVGLLEAYAMVRRVHPHIGPLVVVGQKDFGYDLFFKRMAELGLADNVLVLSGIPDAMLPLLYRAARILVYPSFAEGFGIPVLEAMASGTPVVVSNTTAMPEIVGDSGLLIDPKDPIGIADAMIRLLDDHRLAESCSERGYQQAQPWTWEHAAACYLQSISGLEELP